MIGLPQCLTVLKRGRSIRHLRPWSSSTKGPVWQTNAARFLGTPWPRGCRRLHGPGSSLDSARSARRPSTTP